MKKKHTRRSFLGNGASALAALYAHNLISPSFALAEGGSAPENGKTIILLVKNGGQDMAFSTPYLTSVASKLSSVRPNIHIAPNTALDVLDGNTGLHPNYSPLVPIINDGDFKLIQSCGFESHSKSHQDAQNHMSHAARHLQGAATARGWPARCKDFYNLDLYQLVGFNSGNRLDLKATDPSLVLGTSLSGYNYSNFSSALGGGNGTTHAMNTLSRMLLKVSANSNSVDAAKKSTDNLNNSIATVETVADTVVGSYPGSTLGRNTENLAKLMRWKQLRGDRKNSIYLLVTGGYDTHSNQNGRLPQLITDEAAALAALYTDLKSFGLWNDTTVLSLSEFSRTLRENSGQGTDHAKATTIFAMGGDIDGQGSRSVVGGTPTDSDVDRNYIGTDLYYTDVIKSTLAWWGASSSDINSIIPEESPASSTSLQLFV